MAAYTTIDNPLEFFNTVVYTGNGVAIGSGGNSVTGVGFQADITWIKRRDAVSQHDLYDSVQGAQKRIYPDETYAQDTGVTESLNAWTADGFNLGNSGGGNASGGDYVAWNWFCGTTASGSTTGSGTTKTYSYSVNATSGVSAITYEGNGTTGHTIPHGLGAVPEFIIIKDLASNNWNCYHVTIDWDYIFRLNTNAAAANENNRFQATPTSTVFSLGDDAHTNGNGNNYAAYAFAPKQGFSIFGNYIGNARVPDGRFVYCGFRPAFVIVKNQDAAENWEMMDNKRQGFNAPSTSNKGNWRLIPNSNAAKNTNSGATFTATGFKLIQSSSELNANNDNYSFIAFAAAPLVSSEGVPANSRQYFG